MQPPSNPSEELARITRIVRSLVTQEIDYESLASDIWLECFERNLSPSYTLIANRVRSHCRRVRLEQRTEHQQRGVAGKDSDSVLDLNEIMDRAALSVVERRILFDYYYLKRSIPETAEALRLPAAVVGRTLRETITRLQQIARGLQ